MKRKDITTVLSNIYPKIEAISDNEVKKIQKTLLNLVEVVVEENEKLSTKVQQLKDEINKLKGEQGKPNIGKAKDKAKDHSSEKERNSSGKPKNKKKKKEKNIKIDRKVECELNKDELPNDLQFKGYETNIIQDLEIKSDNIEFRREVYYSPSLKKTFVAKLPDGYYGDFGPGIRSMVLSLYYDSKMTQPAIKKFLIAFDIQISAATISRMITDKHEVFHAEKEDIIKAGLQSTKYQHIDDTGAKVNGENHYTQILSNPFYTAYFTVPKKDRMTILEILCHSEIKFTLNEDSFQLMLELGLSDKNLVLLKSLVKDKVITKTEINEILEQLFPVSNKKKNKKAKKIIMEAAAIMFYQTSKYAVDFLVCDDAPQFNAITKHKMLCWIHEGRHYKKLNPIFSGHKKILDDFITKFWDFYRELLSYKEQPTQEKAKQLSRDFDSIFSTKTGYKQLDERIKKTILKKSMLMLVLQFPFLPLHNNTAELGARYQARFRDINLQNKNAKGVNSKDTFATIVQTASKLGVVFSKYIKDRITKSFEMTSLADLIEQNRQQFITDTS
ncbi:MAG: transposase [Melioribacteraceae bacterium]|nr:transposase [Melioribacteraceae bacterium]